jgi:hypothetical protein
MRQFAAMPDANSKASTAYSPSNQVDNRVLAANIAEPFTVPAGAHFLRLRATNPFWLNDRNNAAIPAADLTDGTGSVYVQYEHLMAIAPGCTAVSVISATTNAVSAEWWA